ncbi:cytochrome c biogenesis protein ResB [Planctomycetota bacterium]
MNILRKTLKLSTIMTPILLTVLSIISAFYGTDWSRSFFNSFAMCIFWVVFVLLLAANLIVFKPLRRGWVLSAHLGIICVLLGGMIGSAAGHKIAARLFGIEKIPSGFILINRGQTETEVSSTNLEKTISRLNFEVTAEDIWIEQYYDGQIKDFKSTLAITKQGRPVFKKTIEVNRPLHYGGYHFYQSGFDMENHQYTILHLVSDSGLSLVYFGYWLIIAGVFGEYWIRPMTKYFKKRRRDGS